MSEHVVETLADAKIGSAVWLFDAQASNYVDGQYKGRGVWKFAIIDGENRASFIIHRQKYDRKTGVCRPISGYSPQLFIFGETERQDRMWGGSAYQISEAVKRCTDIQALKQIAIILGWSP
jgi:hypothetical protein